MKILLVIDNLGSGGAQRQMVNLACALSTRGHHIEFFTYYPQNFYRPILEKTGIQVHLRQKTSRFSVAPVVALRKLIGQSRPDIVLAFLNTPNLYAEFACIGHRETKLVVSERSMYPQGKLALIWRLMQEFHRLSNMITVNSQHQRKRMVELFPWMTKKIKTIYNGYDLEKFAPAAAQTVNPPLQVRFLAVATIVANKNMLGLAKALAICRNRHGFLPRVSWAGRCDGTLQNQNAFLEVTNFIEKEKLAEVWQWLGERKDIATLLQHHDALVHPSFFEGLPNAVCEALSCGRPVLLSRVCDHPRLIDEGVTGFMFDPEAPETIADTIYRFAKLSVKARIDMGVNARKFAEKELSLDKYVNNYTELFTSLVNENH
jgi:glycosyltransferase involved in cell wall biosynthesis